MPHIIKVTFSEAGVTASELGEINSGDLVTWSFADDVADQKLEIRPKGSAGPFGRTSNNEISGEIFVNNSGDRSFDYDIFKDNVRQEWANGRSGGCVKPIGPPRQPVGGQSGPD